MARTPAPWPRSLRRSLEAEILDGDNVPDELAARAYRELTRIHRFLGDTAAVASAIRRDPLPVHRILDIGCGQGGVLHDVRRRLGVVIGVDRRPPKPPLPDVPIIRADITFNPLPAADVAFCLNVVHHLSEEELIALIHNVGRSCRRFLLVDLVRHALPLALFRIFVAPFVSQITAADGLASIRRSFTPGELRGITLQALSGTGATFQQYVNPFFIRQTIDISYSLHVQRHESLSETSSYGAGSAIAKP